MQQREARRSARAQVMAIAHAANPKAQFFERLYNGAPASDQSAWSRKSWLEVRGACGGGKGWRAFMSMFRVLTTVQEVVQACCLRRFQSWMCRRFGWWSWCSGWPFARFGCVEHCYTLTDPVGMDRGTELCSRTASGAAPSARRRSTIRRGSTRSTATGRSRAPPRRWWRAGTEQVRSARIHGSMSAR